MAKPSIDQCERVRLVYLLDATHWVHHEKPEVLVRLIDQVLAEDGDARLAARRATDATVMHGGVRGQQKTNHATLHRIALRSCLVSCRDLAGTEHAVEVTAGSLYDAVAQTVGIRICV